MNVFMTRILTVVMTMAGWHSLATACPSDVDSSFGDAGTTAISPAPHEFGRVSATAIATGGDIYLAGAYGDGTTWHPAVLRMNANGSVDTEFGENGVAVLDVVGGLSAIALDEEGRIVAAGQISEPPYSLLVVRLDDSGMPDPEFGQSGTAVVGNEHSRAWDAAVLGDGRLIVAGDILELGDMPRWIPTLFAFDDNGEPDEGFGDGGATSIELPFSAIGTALERLAGDDLVFAGYGGPDRNHDVFVARLDSTGGLDAGFGSGGVRMFAGDENESAASLGSDEAGRVYLASHVRSDRKTKILVRRLLENGLEDSAYRGGTARIRFPRPHSVGHLAVDSAGTATVLAWRRGNVLLRFTPQGVRDRTFGRRGVYRPSGEGSASSIALQSDGRIVLPGNVGNGIAVSRFEGGQWDGEEPCIVGCGDGLVRIGEKCDDGNVTNGDGCSAACLLE